LLSLSKCYFTLKFCLFIEVSFLVLVLVHEYKNILLLEWGDILDWSLILGDFLNKILICVSIQTTFSKGTTLMVD